MANEKFVKALNREPQAVPPIWLMRQAGRYHKHYRNLRSRYSFMDLCKIPEVAAQTALGPIEDFDFDIAILFSDLLFPLEAMGMGLQYNPGPQLDWQVSKNTLERLRSVDEAWPQLEFQRRAMQATRAVLPKNKSLIGFVGGPWTLFTYAVEGQHKGNLINSKSQPDLFAAFAQKLLPLLQKNIELQLEGGAEVVMILDTAAGELSPMAFEKWCVPHLSHLARLFPRKLGYYSKGTQSAHLGSLRTDSSWAGFGFDHGWPLAEVLKSTTQGFIQGNFDQALMFLPRSELKSFLREHFQPVLDLSPEERAGWVCGLGHGVLPGTPEDNVKLFVELVRELFHKGE